MTYEEAVGLIEHGGHWIATLKTKCLVVDRKTIIKDGEIIDDEFKDPFTYYGWDYAELLYKDFKHSRPHEKDRQDYFKALSADELAEDELAYGTDRNVALFRLELYLMLGGEWLKVKMDGQHWFYQGFSDKDFVVLKEWL